MSKVEQWAPSKYITIEPTRAIDVQKEEGDKGYKVPSMDDLVRLHIEDRVMIRFINKASVWLTVVRTEDDVHDAETDSSDDDDPMGNEEHPDIAERVLYCRVDPSEEIKKLKEPTLQGNQRVKIRYEHIVKVEFADGSSDDDYSD